MPSPQLIAFKAVDASGRTSVSERKIIGNTRRPGVSTPSRFLRHWLQENHACQAPSPVLHIAANVDAVESDIFTEVAKIEENTLKEPK